ncbi:putative ABC transport system substrate-binding protein [Peptoclostridium litorale DSM 5388]|uniref:ABC transporter substrate binding protein n=1 Tax=Peptoclostridium litorale DSM 5388 TaxID=1121324 RepID=A0A069RC50_PEPLI|nr:ABC transporter substrate-binding protein [Peptoclostridium litorale]KDR94609.1 ABC transporter substrate binding protein [Peptoclostridium litorale DSM 5388]SIO32088.1 putative ABC transport system substrate-binding protein [Peptoclostridium litorale DSM 5388]
MARKLISIFCVTLLLSLSVLTGCSNDQEASSGSSDSNSSETYSIGISQIVEHPALDSSRQGIIDALAEEGFVEGKNLDIEFQNAQGDMPTAQTIADGFVSSKKDMIVAIATPCAQTALNATKDIPIIVTAITDPVGAGLVNSLEKPGGNVTGTSDATPIDKQFSLIKSLIPNAKKIGIIYNTSEANSVVQVENAKKAAQELGFEIVEAGITSVNDIDQTLNSILPQIDVLYTPADNMVASAMALISNKCTEKGKAVIGAEEGHVKGGALATEGIDYYTLGLQTGKIAARVLNGENPGDIPVSLLEETSLVINEKTAKALGLQIPQDILERAEILKGDE